MSLASLAMETPRKLRTPIRRPLSVNSRGSLKNKFERTGKVRVS